MLRLWWTVRSFKADVLVYLMPIRSVKSVRRDKLFFWLTGVRRIVGLPSEQENEYDFDPSTGLYETEASRLSRCLAELGEARLEDAASWWLRLSAEEQLAAVIALEPAGSRPVIAVSLGTKWQPNDWGAQNWLKLLSRLAEKWPTHALVLLGAANEREKCEDAAEGWRKSGQPVINLCGKMTPRQSAAVLIKAELFLGHDSGPMHLAAAMQVPCVAVFSARNLPGKWFPSGKRHRVIYHRVDCMGCGLVSCIEEKKRCILSVTVGEMEEAANSILSDKLIVERNS
jgi:ADP-heptose:LPS heptosyltransferase